MAAVDLKDLNWNNGGANWKQSSVGVTNQEFQIPKWCKLVTVKAAGQGIVFSYSGTDGGTPVSHAFPQPVDSIIQYNPVQTSTDRSIFIAAATGTATIYLIFE